MEESIEETRRRREIIEQLLIRILGERGREREREREREGARYKTCATSRQHFYL